MLDPHDPAHGGDWTRRLEATERRNRFAEATRRARAAFDKHESRTLDQILGQLREMYEASERARAEETAARAEAERRQLIYAVAAISVTAAGIVVGVLVALLA